MNIPFYNVKVAQDDDGNWWLEYYVDDIRYGVSLDEIHAAQENINSQCSHICPNCGGKMELVCLSSCGT